MNSVLPRKKVLIPRFTEESLPRLTTEGKWHEKYWFYKKSCSSKQNVFVRDSFGREFQEFASIFVPGNGIPSCWLFRGMVRNRNPRVCFYFCSTERNSELFSLPRNGSERNPESLLLFLFHSAEFQAFFSFAERFGTEFREFSILRNSRNSAGTNQLFRLFRLPRNNFFVGNCQPYLVPNM